MPNYPTTASDTFIDAQALLDRVTAIFLRTGLSGNDAHLVAESLVIADLRGVHSHGVLRVPEYVKKLTVDGVDPKARPFVATERVAALVIDGSNAMGQIACAFAMDRAVEKASSNGIAMAAVRGSNHCGALFHSAMRALAKDQIGIVGTNALPTMAPWGGIDKILGINPIAFAIPAGDEPPIVFDAAFSASSHGKIRIYHQKGLDIPDGWAFDAAGNPTTKTAEALTGLLQPIGAFKGTGLAVIVGILSSMLSGAAYGLELGNMVDGPRPGHDGQFAIAIDIAAFIDPTEFKSRVDAAIRQIRTSRPATGHGRCYAPGELEHETETRYRETGIPLNAETLAGLTNCE